MVTPPAKVYTGARMEEQVGEDWASGLLPWSIAVAPDNPSLIYVSAIGIPEWDS
jgi:hypothetical protein